MFREIFLLSSSGIIEIKKFNFWAQGHTVAQIGLGTALQTGRSWVRFRMLSFHWHNPSSRTMVLGPIQPVTEMSTRDISWGKGGWCVGLATLPPSCVADCLEIWEPQTPGTLRASNWIALPLPVTCWGSLDKNGNFVCDRLVRGRSSTSLSMKLNPYQF